MPFSTIFELRSSAAADTNESRVTKRTPTGLHRLDARLRVPAHVPDALLQFLALARGPKIRALRLLATWRHASRSTVYFSCGHFLRARHRKTSPKGNPASRHRANDDSPQRGNLRAQS